MTLPFLLETSETSETSQNCDLKKNEDFLKKVGFLAEKNQKKYIIGIEGQTSPFSL